MSFSYDSLLGLPLAEAERILAERGESMRVIVSRAPRTERSGGTPRVVRVRDGVLTVCEFPDGIPARSAQ